MSIIAYHASHEQFPPSRLVKLAIMAEKSGFGAVHSSDHFHPWSYRQGNSGFAFSWLGAAMQATKLPYSMVCAPGQRYHPAIVAQAFATLSEMFPRRFIAELGSGEALNEMITGEPWPSKPIRNERLLESATIIRRLMNGEEVTHHGHVHVSQAKIFSLPALTPPLFCAALSEETSGWAGSWADGLLTTGGIVRDTEKKIERFRKNGGAGKPFFIQLSFSYGADEKEAIDVAYEQWRTNLLPADKRADLCTPKQFDEQATHITRKEIAENIKTIARISDLFEWLEPYKKMGADRIILHNINTNQEIFIRDFGSYNRG